MTRHTHRTVLDLELVRDTLRHADEVGALTAAKVAGVDHSTVYRWRARRDLNGGTWPTDEHIAEWKRADAAAAVHREQHRRYMRRVVAHGAPMLVDPTGTLRRIQALAALGWRYSDIAARTPFGGAFVGHLAITTRTRINADTARSIRAAYDQLSGTPGPSAKSRTYARRKGWAPPLSWDDDTIDDPAAKPIAQPDRAPRGLDEVAIHRAMHGEHVRLTRAEKREAVRQLTARGLSLDAISARLHCSTRQVERYRVAA